MSRAVALLLAGVLLGCGKYDPGAHANADAGGLRDAGGLDAHDGPSADAGAVVPPPAVIVLIGDGMGRGQVETASLYRHGRRNGLAMQQLASVGWIRTASPSGITDSAAAATVMGTGVRTYNDRVGLDRHGAAVENLVERAGDRGWSTGVVTTTSLPHATPAGFTAHVPSRSELYNIAEQMVRRAHPDVMLGGGGLHFPPALHEDLSTGGYTIVTTKTELAAAALARPPRLFGAFAPDHLTFAASRTADSTEPTLAEMTGAALTTLERDPHGFFLMVEGGRIDHGGHANSLPDVVHETLAFDDAVAHVVSWARARGNVTVLVTADHETGGLEIVEERPAGEYPLVRWRWGNHTNDRVFFFAEGPGTAMVGGAVLDHRALYEIVRSRLDRREAVEPPREVVPDGELDDLRHLAVRQTVSPGAGAGQNQLDSLWLDATEDGLYVGIEGLFGWADSAVEVWIDVDPLDGTGYASPAGHLADEIGAADHLVAASRVGPPATPFGVDFALVSIAGADPKLEELRDDGGLRALHPPFGQPTELGWLAAAINFGATRTRMAPTPPVPGQGLEAFIPWASLYAGGMLPVGARVRLAAMLVNATGELASNQFLPPLPASAGDPGDTPIQLPGVIEYVLDADSDGRVDGDQVPVVLP